MEQVFLFVLAIVVIGLGFDLLKTHLESKRRARATVDDEAHLEQLARLEERIEVLEKIVTDERYDLKRRIDSL